MDQVRLFLTEYSGWITMAVSGVVFILLAVTLHRIKGIGRLIRENTTDTKRILVCVEQEAEARKSEAETARRQTMQEITHGQQPVVASVSGGAPEELIDAVLEEVFP